MPNDTAIREHLVALLRGGQAYDTFANIVAEFPPETRGVVPAGAERSAWQILEHLRIAQRDILDYSRNDDGSYVEIDWPDGYWPKSPTPPSAGSWDDSVKAFLADRAELEALISNPQSDLCAPFAWGDSHTLLREALVAADHNSHHIGQLVVLRRLVSD